MPNLRTLAATAVCLAAPLAAAQPFSFARQIAPFDVREDGADAPLAYPFLGGFDEPKPQWVDLDGDGDDDLVVLDLGRELLFYESLGGPETLVPRPGALASVDVQGGWFQFGDVDGDGDFDLLMSAGFGQVAFWRNDGTPQAAAFVLAESPLLRSDGQPVGLESANMPDLADVDGDGDLDLLGGRTDQGTIAFYRHDGVSGGVPQYTFVTNAYGDLVIFEFDPQCPGSGVAPGTPSRSGNRHGQNGLAFVDLEADGDLDLFWGDFFSYGVRYFRSGGGADLTFVTEDYPNGEDDQDNGFFIPAFGDPDGDGDLDLLYGNLRGFCGGRELQTRIDNTLYYENVGSRTAPAYERRTDRFLRTFDLGTKTTGPAVGDFDGDGDPDVVLAVGIDPDLPGTALRRSALHYLRNDGTPGAPALVEVETDLFGLDFGQGAEYAPAAGDLNGDGTPDLIVADFNGRFAVSLSPGGPAPIQDFVRSDALLADVRQQSVPRPALGDLDGDGDLDLLIGRSNGAIAFWENVGTAQAAQFERVTEDLLGADDLFGVAPALGDLDGDGDPDLVVGYQRGEVRLFRNDGALAFAEVARFDAGARRPTPTLADLDGDGDPDLLAGTESGGLLYYESLLRLDTVPPPAPPARFRAYPNPSAGAVTFDVGALTMGGTVEIVDVLGRSVARLPVTGGAERVRWDTAAEAGLYVARLVSREGAVVATARLSVVR